MSRTPPPPTARQQLRDAWRALWLSADLAPVRRAFRRLRLGAIERRIAGDPVQPARERARARRWLRGL